MNYRSQDLSSRHGQHKILVGQYVGAGYIEKLRRIVMLWHCGNVSPFLGIKSKLGSVNLKLYHTMQ
jgi:hypothetical protein